jgi:hypothetical protein
MPWNWNCVSCNPNITIKFIKENRDKSWDWYQILKNPNITIKDIKENPGMPLFWDYISLNPNITMEFIEANLDKPWDWSCLVFNDFNYYKLKKEREEAQRRDKAARIIQAGCEDWIWKPVLKDGTPGIKVRLLHKHFEAINRTIAEEYPI